MIELRNFRELLYSSAEKFPDRIAFLWKNEDGKEESVTYRQLKSDAEALGKALIKRGCKNRKIALCGKNSYEWCLCYLAVTAFVGVIVPVDKELPSDELMNVLRFSECDAVFCDKAVSKKIGDGDFSVLSMETDLNLLLDEGRKCSAEISG